LRRKNLKKLKGSSQNYNTTDKQLAEEFDLHLQNVMGQLSSEIESLDGHSPDDQFDTIGRGGCIILAKTRLIDLLINKLAEYTKAADCEQN
jgi:hypothetical protein